MRPSTSTLAILALLTTSPALATPNTFPDGDFELGIVNGTDYWKQNSTHGTQLIAAYNPVQPWNICFQGGPPFNETSVIVQDVGLDYDMVNLVFDTHLYSNDVCGMWDVFTVTVTNLSSNSGAQQVRYDLCAANNHGWQTEQIPFVASAGDDIRIMFTVDTDHSGASWLLIDNVTTN